MRDGATEAEAYGKAENWFVRNGHLMLPQLRLSEVDGRDSVSQNPLELECLNCVSH